MGGILGVTWIAAVILGTKGSKDAKNSGMPPENCKFILDFGRSANFICIAVYKKYNEEMRIRGKHDVKGSGTKIG